MKLHEVVILTDSHDEYPMPAGLRIDGRDMVVPADSPINVSTASRSLTTVQVELFAESVNFQRMPEPIDWFGTLAEALWTVSP